MKQENFEHCKKIALYLEDIYNGKVYCCSNCAEEYTVETGEEPPVKCTCGNEELYQLAICDYLCSNEIYDVEYRIGQGEEEIRSVRLMIACGGPNIYIDTASKSVELYWWNESASYLLDDDVCNEINYWMNEYYKCGL